jgi:CubicO group peptidase (beta-lactamase class C family)
MVRINGAVLAAILLFGFAGYSMAQENAQEGQSAPAEEVYRWYIGVEGGYAYNRLFSSSGYRAFTEYQDGHGFMVGIPVQYRFFDWFALQSGVQYIQKNYALARTEMNSAIRSEWTNRYLELPVLSTFSFGGSRLRGFFNAGGFIGLWLDSHIKGTGLGVSENPYDPSYIQYVDYDEKVSWDDERDNRFEAGLIAGTGIQYRFDAFTVFIEGRYSYGLTDMQKDYMYNKVPRINDTLTIQTGVIFNAGIFNLVKGGKK